MMGGEGDGVAGAEPELESKKVHPFFSAPKKPASSKDHLANAARPVTPESCASPGSEQLDPTTSAPAALDDNEAAQGRQKRRKTDSMADVKQSSKPVPQKKPKARVSTGSNIVQLFAQKDKDGTSGSGADDPAGTNGATEPVEGPGLSTNDSLPPLAQAPAPSLGATAVAPVVVAAAAAPAQEDSTKPKKILKFNPKTGTIGSPPKPKVPTVAQADHVDSKPSGRPRRTKKIAYAAPFVVHIRYGTLDDDARISIGEKIEEIFSGVPFIHPKGIANMSSNSQPAGQGLTPPSSSLETPKSRTPNKRGRPRKATSTHPLFSSKSSAVTPAQAEEKPKSPVKRNSIFTSTPCSPKRTRQPLGNFSFPQFGMKAGGFKFPGAQQAAWPWKGMVHIRGDDRDMTSSHHEMPYRVESRNRKSKGRQIDFPADESVLYRAASRLRIHELVQELLAVNTDEFLPAPATLRIPERHFESGRRLQDRVKPELRTLALGSSDRTHPAIAHAYNLLATSLSAFDQSTCEGLSWTQKYSPTTSDRVLQGGREAEMLRDWLRTLKVQAVDTGASDGNGTKAKTAPPKKKKRKKLDDFVISSDEENAEMDEISETEADWMPTGGQGGLRTVVRPRPSKDSRLTNAVLLSGPHGCGKTATAYAIAKELDFEVFEISAGSRRSGKDILEKIGDMTRNHLVQHKQEVAKPEEEINDEDVARDIKSGKQGMMTAFFKPKADAKPKPDAKRKTENIKPVEKVAKLAVDKPIQKNSGQSQKQSLILLEEVDILYEEDKQFWATVISLMAQSKRPFIMTCSDEALVPIQSLNLHGIFRFNPVPRDLATDLLLLIAANEGHALKRSAVEALYESRKQDLRASIHELNYWCQIGVGDPKGGLGWFYRRWPEGSDLDEHGNRIRVISCGTYQHGMGWLGRDAIASPSSGCTTEEELIYQAWQNWSLDMRDCESTAVHQGWPDLSGLPREDRMALLETTDSFYDSLSAADVSSYGSLSSLNQVVLDSTLPAIPAKAKNDFIIGLQALESPILSHYNSTAFEISASIRCLAQTRILTTDLAIMANHYPLDESKTTQKIQDSFGAPSPSSAAISRYDYSIAFDPIAVSESANQSSGYLDPSVFDRTMRMITLDVAPYVRSITAYDQRLQAERLLRSNLLSEGGKPKKRVRTTRAAWSALEGGSRASTRREKYFSAEINPHLVMRTGGKGWETLTQDVQDELVESRSSPAEQESSDDMDTTME
ncbi:hypothetical protein JX265_009749 [Neoarthrinium moseri]|uniref:AAA+ ATPase domain-containing protein n=1 Tax=Neoarthrinium moseri TaxID=1658444 RepID=A0A9P9WFS0_9PEZI|nr:hypothetical protein JX265_009749 [Neoarthrinium moseri]